jgi:hypothetical protein
MIVPHDDGVRVFIDGQLLLSAPGPHDGSINEAISRTLGFENGQPAPGRRHEIAIAYQEYTGESELHLAWRKPDGTVEEIPADAFSH